MKVLQLVTQMEAGGAQRVAYLLQTELARRGKDSRLGFLYTRRPAYAGLPNVVSLSDTPPSALGYLQILFRLARLIHAERPEVVITHTHYANVMGQVVARAFGVRHRIAVQHNPTETYPGSTRTIDRVLGSTGLYTRVVAVSETVAQSVASYPRPYRDRLAICYNGVPAAAEPKSSEITRRRWGVPQAVPLLINVGRFSVQKNQQFLLRLLALDPQLHLVLVGDGELRAQLHQLTEELAVGDRVHFTGEVPPDDVSSLMAASDLFVLPSLFEAVGMVVLEAMALGVPVLSNDIPSSHEFLSDDGVITAISSPERWLAAIHMLCLRGDGVVQMIARARQRSGRFTVPRMADAYQALFEPIGPLRWENAVAIEHMGESSPKSKLRRQAEQSGEAPANRAAGGCLRNLAERREQEEPG